MKEKTKSTQANEDAAEQEIIPIADIIAAMEEGERIARDPNAKSYTVEELFAELNKDD